MCRLLLRIAGPLRAALPLLENQRRRPASARARAASRGDPSDAVAAATPAVVLGVETFTSPTSASSRAAHDRGRARTREASRHTRCRARGPPDTQPLGAAVFLCGLGSRRPRRLLAIEVQRRRLLFRTHSARRAPKRDF